jgi:predicted small metal-binding protein
LGLLRLLKQKHRDRTSLGVTPAQAGAYLQRPQPPQWCFGSKSLVMGPGLRRGDTEFVEPHIAPLTTHPATFPLPPRLTTPHNQEDDMKRFDSGTLIPGATWRAEADTEAEVVRRAVENLRTFHGEDEVRPDMIERIKERIIDVSDTKH